MLTEIECIVFQFAILLGVIFILEIAAGAYAYSKKDKVSWAFYLHWYQSYGSFSLPEKNIFCLNEFKLKIANYLSYTYFSYQCVGNKLTMQASKKQ